MGGATMGRPPVKEAKQQYTIMLKPSVVKEIDRIAERIGLTRSQLMANYIEFGMEETKGMEQVGIIKAVSVYRKMTGKPKSGKLSSDEIGKS